MEKENETQVTEFILLGFSYKPQTKMLLFVLLLIVYLISVTANSLFIIVTLTDSRLHSPMYFFLCNLSFLDLCYSSVNAPTILEGLLVQKITIIYVQCMTQMCMTVFLAEAECFLLAVMAWDRYIAICNPLRYQQIINDRVCVKLAITTWGGGFLCTLSSVVVLSWTHFCGHNVIDHITCEAEALSRLTCMDTLYKNISSLASAFLVFVVPACIILFTYLRIIFTILHMPRTDRRHKAFTTCGSHLVVITLFYGLGMGVYLKPKSSVQSKKHKLISVFYTLVVPALNPLIYTFRNKDVKKAVQHFYSMKMQISS